MVGKKTLKDTSGLIKTIPMDYEEVSGGNYVLNATEGMTVKSLDGERGIRELWVGKNGITIRAY